MNTADLFAAIDHYLDNHIPLALATVIETRGSTPREVGAKMVVLPNGEILGTVGGGCGEARVKHEALRILNEANQPEIIAVDLSESLNDLDGDVCGGMMRVLIEPLRQ